MAELDKYSNILGKAITMSAANTLTFEAIELGLSLFDKVGILIQRIEFDPAFSAVAEMVANSDRMQIALTQSNQIASITLQESSVICAKEYQVHVSGAPATAQIAEGIQAIDYTSLAGGGLLIAPRPLYLAMTTAGFAAASGCTIRLYFTVVKLKPEEYFELLESRQYFG